VNITTANIERMGEKQFGFLSIRDLAVDSNRVWLVTSEGVFLYKKNQPVNQWEKLRDPQGKLDYYGICVLLDDTVAWFAGENFAVCYHRQQETWDYYVSPAYFNGCTIFSMTADTENVWFATNNGVFKYHKKYRRWKHFTTQDGLAHNFVRSIVLDGDYVWFGTAQGITRYFWNRLHHLD
jgi:ligand-binding sensor domain-containing protein